MSLKKLLTLKKKDIISKFSSNNSEFSYVEKQKLVESFAKFIRGLYLIENNYFQITMTPSEFEIVQKKINIRIIEYLKKAYADIEMIEAVEFLYKIINYKYSTQKMIVIRYSYERYNKILFTIVCENNNKNFKSSRKLLEKLRVFFEEKVKNN